MPLTMDPSRISPTAGVLVTKIVEVLGGYTKSGLFLPGIFQDHSGKDTVLVQVLRKGPPPEKRYIEGGVRDCLPWAPVAANQVSVGDVILVSRDVPLVFVWEDQRYALVYEHEAICAMSYEFFASGGFEMSTWTPGVIGDTVIPMGTPIKG